MMNYKKEKQSIAKTVDDILSSKPFIQDLFKIDAVNYSGLARHITPEIKTRLNKEKINTEAVIMAVKRYSEKAKGDEISEDVRKIVSKCSLFLKNDVSELTVRKSNRMYDVILDLQKKVDYLRGEVLYILQSTGEIEIVTDKKISNELLTLLCEEDILHKENALALIGVKIPETTISVPGVIYHLSGFLALEGITLIDTTSTFTEITFIINEKDASKAYSLLYQEIKKQRSLVL